MNYRHARPENLFLPDRARQLCLCLVSLLLLASSARAQVYSYDGQRWYEAEVSIFTHEPVPELFPEIRDLEGLSLVYPQRITVLRTMGETLQLPEDMFNPSRDLFSGETANVNGDVTVVVGPEYSPGTSTPVIQDVASDPFTRVGSDAVTFSRHNSRLRNASGHRLLFHAVWRFPVKSEAQTTYVAVNGGGFYSPHFELEGYVGFSLNGNRIDLRADLWLMEFAASSGRARDTDVVDVPYSPTALETDESGMILEPQKAFLVEDVWQLKELRPMISRQLHYLDHPRLGVIAEVRPYQLPQASPEP